MTATDQAPTRKTGFVVWYDSKKGFGYIGEKGAPGGRGNGSDWYVNQSDLMDGDLSAGERVSFYAGLKPDGRRCARCVERT
jgi:cold shock CspA family protein